MMNYKAAILVEAGKITIGQYNDYRKCENSPKEGCPVRNKEENESPNIKQQVEETCYETHHMTFGEALEVLKKRRKVAREGWNGKGMFLLYVPSEKWGIIDKIGLGIPKGNLLSWIGMKTADGKFVPWLASQTDMLAEDWVIVE